MKENTKPSCSLFFDMGGLCVKPIPFFCWVIFFRFNWTATPWSFSWKWLVWCCFFADYDLVTLIWTYKEVNAVLQKRTYSNSVVATPLPLPGSLVSSKFPYPSVTSSDLPQYLGVLDSFCFEHLKHFFSLYCSRVFQLFRISFGEESSIFQVFPNGVRNT